MTCPNLDRQQLTAFDAASAAHGPCSASDRGASAESTPQLQRLTGSLMAARDRHSTLALLGPNKRLHAGISRALTNIILGLYSEDRDA